MMEAPRARLAKAFDTFLDVASLSDLDVARRLSEQEVAIAIDLKGLTGNNRIGIFAHRPAPIQVGYLGYPATVGSDFIDYALADPIVLPFDQQEH
jgi:predicted O-linked N-acetylglucosamine transferase (SPINDLY family)